MQNIEFKVELRNLEAARRQCALLGARSQGILRQTDTYYRLVEGRLKKREMPGQTAQWIFYHRMDRSRPRMSTYSILTDAQAKRRWGSRSLRFWLTVMKSRELWLLDEVRIHLDQVDKIGMFMEFEAKVSRSFDVKACHTAVTELRQTFAPLLGEPISCSYSDLMEQALAEKC